MRRLLLIAMLVLLPLQFVWGAAAAYCGHEEGSAAGHFGHHAHKHQAKTPKQSDEPSADRAGTSGLDDTDCGYCHLACVSPVISPTVVVWGIADHLLGMTGSEDLPPHVSSSIERPNWAPAA